MKKDLKSLIKENIYLLIPFILYGIYKNGYLIYQKNLISFIKVLKPFYLCIIGIVIKIVIDLIKYKKINFDYSIIYVILLSMIMPYNINYLIYIFLLSILLFLSTYIKNIKINKICLIYLIIILINGLVGEFTFLNPMENKFVYNFEFLDYLFGRNIGGISSTSIILSLISFAYLLNNFYYKKDIPFIINLTYLICAFLYFIITNNVSLLLNSELIFASVFIAPLPEFSPYKKEHQIIYAILIGITSFMISLFLNKVIAIYISIFLVSFINLLSLRQNMTK